MSTLDKEINSAFDLELNLMTSALFYGEFAAIQPLLQSESRLALAIKKNDLQTMQKLTRSLLTDSSMLDEAQVQAFETLYDQIEKDYAASLKQQAMPLPESFLEKVVEAALEKQKYLTAHNILDTTKKLDKGVNELLNQTIQLLQSREVAQAEKEHSAEADRKIDDAAICFYKAIRLKYPLGLEFQYRAVEELTAHKETRRKYERYVEQGESVLKEIINACLYYLANDQAITDKILNHIKNNRVRKQFLKRFCILLTGGEEKFQAFISNFNQAREHITNAKTEYEFLRTQRILLGRTAGSETLIQYLKELATVFPISPMIMTIAATPDQVSYLSPLMLKDKMLLEILDLDK